MIADMNSSIYYKCDGDGGGLEDKYENAIRD